MKIKNSRYYISVYKILFYTQAFELRPRTSEQDFFLSSSCNTIFLFLLLHRSSFYFSSRFVLFGFHTIYFDKLLHSKFITIINIQKIISIFLLVINDDYFSINCWWWWWWKNWSLKNFLCVVLLTRFRFFFNWVVLRYIWITIYLVGVIVEGSDIKTFKFVWTKTSFYLLCCYCLSFQQIFPSTYH